MKLNIDKHRTEREFAEGDWVYLRLLPYKQKSMRQKHLGKLSPRYYGPFQILQKVGKVSYKLDLPPSSRLHPTFHVLVLRANWVSMWLLFLHYHLRIQRASLI